MHAAGLKRVSVGAMLVVALITGPAVMTHGPAPAAAADQTTVLSTGTADGTGVLGARWRKVRFSSPVSGSATLRLDWTGTGDLDMSLFNAATGTRLAIASNASKPKVISFALTGGTAYDAAVWAETGTGTYTLTLTAPDASAVETRPLSTGVADATGALGAKWRKVRFSSPVSGTATLRLDWTGTGDLDMSLFNAATGTRLAIVSDAAKPKVISFALTGGTAYDAAVWAETGTGTYTLTLTAPGRVLPPAGSPNILLINTDDQRYDTLGALPAVQRWLVSKGTTYTGSYVTTPSCCPSRASLMTGKYVHNNGQYQQQTLGIDLTATTQQYLHDAGYYTAHAGKFLNWMALADRAPGFDRWTSYRGGYENVAMNIDGTVTTTSGYSTTIMFDKALEYLQSFETGNDARPWMLSLAPTAPHLPAIAEPKHASDAVPPYQPTPDYLEADRSDKPTWVRNRNTTDAAMQAVRTDMIRALYSVDDGVERVMARLQATGELANTLVVFTSDNGFMWGEHQLNEKFLPYTPAVAVPLVIRWDGRVAAAATDARPVAQVDIAPTLVTMAGQGSRASGMDGRSLFGGTTRSTRFMEYWQDPSNIAAIPSWASIRTSDAWYTEYYSDAALTVVAYREYYDMRVDPHQLVNLLGDATTANDPPTAALHTQLVALMKCKTTTCP